MLQVTWSTWRDERAFPWTIGGLISIGGLLGLTVFRLREKWVSKPSSVSQLSPQDEASFKEGVAKLKLAAAMLGEVVAADLQLPTSVRPTEEAAAFDEKAAKLRMEEAKPTTVAAKLRLVIALLEWVANTNYPFGYPKKP